MASTNAADSWAPLRTSLQGEQRDKLEPVTGLKAVESHILGLSLDLVSMIFWIRSLFSTHSAF